MDKLDFGKLDGSLQFGGPDQGPMKVRMADISWVKRKYLDIAYDTQSKNQVLDLYLPEEGDGPFRVIFHIHGGGFGLGDKRDDHLDTYLKFLKKGIAVGSIEYRLSGEAIFPAAVLDCRQAVRYMKEHASEYMLDVQHFGVIGGSAGGNLSALLGMNIPDGTFFGEGQIHSSFDCSVTAAIDQFGPIDFLAMDDQARENGISFVDHDRAESAESSYLGKALPEIDPEYAALANPMTYINEAMAPLLVQHGCSDRLVPYAQSVELVKAIQAQLGENRVQFTTLPTADHEDKQYGSDENMDILWKFIDQNL